MNAPVQEGFELELVRDLEEKLGTTKSGAAATKRFLDLRQSRHAHAIGKGEALLYLAGKYFESVREQLERGVKK